MPVLRILASVPVYEIEDRGVQIYVSISLLRDKTLFPPF